MVRAWSMVLFACLAVWIKSTQNDLLTLLTLTVMVQLNKVGIPTALLGARVMVSNIT